MKQQDPNLKKSVHECSGLASRDSFRVGGFDSRQPKDFRQWLRIVPQILGMKIGPKQIGLETANTYKGVRSSN